MVTVKPSLEAGYALAKALKILRVAGKNIETKLSRDGGTKNLNEIYNELFTLTTDIQNLLKVHIEDNS